MTTQSVQPDLPKLSQSKSTPLTISSQITKPPSNQSIDAVNNNLNSFPLNIVLRTSNNTKIRVELREILETALSMKDDMNTLKSPSKIPKKVSFSNEDDDEHKNYKIGDLVIISKNKQGLIRYIGELHYDTAIWYGVELIGGHRGYHDGQFQGQRYFTCSSNQGIFIKKHQIIRRMNHCDFENDTKSKRGTPRFSHSPNTPKQKKKREKKLGPRDIGKIKGWKPSREIYQTEQELKAEEIRSRYKAQQKKGGAAKRSSLTEIEAELFKGGSLFKSTTTKQVEKKPGPRDIGRVKSKETDWRPIQNADKIIESEKKKGFLDPSTFKSNTQRRHRALSSALLVRKSGPPKVTKTRNKKRGDIRKKHNNDNNNQQNEKKERKFKTDINKLSINKLSLFAIDSDEMRTNKYKSKTPTPSTNGLINVNNFEYNMDKKDKRSKRRKKGRSGKKRRNKHCKRDRSDSETASPTSPTPIIDNILVTPIDTTKRTRSRSKSTKRKSEKLKKPKKKKINNDNDRRGGRVRSRTVTTRSATTTTQRRTSKQQQKKTQSKYSKHDESKSVQIVLANNTKSDDDPDGIPGFPKRSKSAENELILHSFDNDDNNNNNNNNNGPFPDILNFSKHQTDESQTSDDLYRVRHGNTLSLHSTSKFYDHHNDDNNNHNNHKQSHSANYDIEHKRNKTDGSIISDTSVTIRVPHGDNSPIRKKKKNHRKKKSQKLNMSETATVDMFDNDAFASSSDSDGDGDDDDIKIDDNDTLYADINAEIEERKSGLQDIEKQLNELATTSAEFDIEFKKHLEEAQMNQNQFKQNHNQIIQEIESDFEEVTEPKNSKTKIKRMLWTDDDNDDDDDVLNITHSNNNGVSYIE